MTPQPQRSADTPTAPCVWAAQNHLRGGEAPRPSPTPCILTVFLPLPSAPSPGGPRAVDEDTHAVNGMTHELTGQLTESGWISRATWRALPLSSLLGSRLTRKPTAGRRWKGEGVILLM